MSFMARSPICCRAWGASRSHEQISGPQAVSIESSVAQFHGSRGRAKPASPELLSEPAIVAGIAQRRRCRTKRRRGISGSAITRSSATPSRRPIPKLSRTSTRSCFSPAGLHGLFQRASANGSLIIRKQTSSRRNVYFLNSPPLDRRTMCFILRRCAPTINSTRQFMATAIASAASTVRGGLYS